MTKPDLDRPASRRLARNLALSLSGGAILTVLGAGVAHADDGASGSASGGAGAAHSGDATAVGNRSGTQKNQTASASGALGNLQVVDQTAAVANVGVAVANTGGNRAVGNESANTATGTQGATSASGGATNGGTAANSSNGTALVSTGNASAVGNESTTTIDQSSNGAARGALGVLVVNQTGAVLNAGVAVADTGRNEAIGNTSENEAGVVQGIAASQGLAANNAKARNDSGGLATISTGGASAVGNQSDSKVLQSTQGAAGGDGLGGLVLLPQLGVVANVGIGAASSGGNTAVGNASTNGATTEQHVVLGEGNVGTTEILGVVFESQTGEASTASDGSAAIVTGAADATGNASRTELGQTAGAGIDGMGFVLSPQVGVVANVGLGVATSGNNRATGNESDNDALVAQFADVAGGADFLNGGDVFLAAPIIVASNEGTVTAASDGTATIETGRASSTGNRSETDLTQDADGHVDGFGFVVDPQVGVVINAGIGRANSGDNDAIGNTSGNRAGANQEADVAAHNVLEGDTSLVALSTVTAANSADIDASSDGDGTVRTGAATAVGNDSNTELTQDATGHAPGMVLDTQAGVVVNVGLASADTGQNFATGNGSQNNLSGGEGGPSSGTFVSQTAQILSGNANFLFQGPLDRDLSVAGPATASNTVSAFDPSDGSATIRTGDAQAQGNVSSTVVDQATESHVPGLGGVLSTQVAAVANVGVGVADTGENIADGNVSASQAGLDQIAQVGSGNADSPVDFAIVGPATASNSGEAGSTSDGTATVGTGNAVATGNASTTTLSQRQSGEVEGLGLTIGTQVGGVANLGVGIANTGDNTATGNESTGHYSDGEASSAAAQSARLNSFGTDPAETTILGPATASNTASVTNTSDGEACICTGDAVASGNISSTTFVQGLDLTATSGVIVITEVGGVLNAGVGVANSGLNTAVGNSSENLGTAAQVTDIDDALLEPVDGPQTSSNGMTLSNDSNGSGHVGSGNASGTGNQSTTTFAQAAAVDSGFAVSNLVGATANAGAGIANSGDNHSTGNDSVNEFTLFQDADGSGLVANQGEGTNASDGTAIIGDPHCCGDEAVPPGATPGETPGALPRTGGELQAEAVIALMLLLAGSGLRRRTRQVV